MIFCLPLILILISTEIFSDKLPISFQIQNVDQVVSLDSDPYKQSFWYVTEGDRSLEALTDISKLQWSEVLVPGNAIKSNPNLAGKKNILLLKKIKLPKEQSGNLALRLGVINDRDVVYWNGKKIAETGKWDSEEPQSYDKIRIYSLPSHLVRFGEENTLLIHVQPYFDYTIGIEQDTTAIGPSELIYKKFYTEEFTKLLFLVVYLSFGSYFLFLFIRRKRESENLFFALFAFNLVFYNVLRNQIKYEFDLPFLFMKRIEYMLLISLIPLMFHFIRNLFDFKYSRFFQILDCLEGLFLLGFVFSKNIEFYNWFTTKFIQPSWIFYTIGILYFLVKRISQKNKKATVILVGVLFVLAASIIDILSTRGYFVFPRLLGYVFLAFIICLSLILANSFVRLHEEVEDLNKNLEKKVNERTEELNHTLEKVSELMEIQDGDYFLTSLLINPLARNDNQSKLITTEFYSKQKKHFSFRGKESEIGGDICISDSIQIKGQRYTVFINGDAMGKSIQGAGGALVLGVVFHAVVTRTKLSENEIDSPEIWLRDLILELQRIYESFDGSMLTSIFLGLIEESSGFMYYVNAEHPWSILYRDEKASFIETELSLRKLGFPRNLDSFRIKTFPLLPGDILICGSDGRDDLAIETQIDQKGRTINEDETLILKFVETGKARLESIVKELETYGELTDDLTLIRVEYFGESEKQISHSPTLEDLDRIRSLYKSQHYTEAIVFIKELVKEYPNHTKLLQYLGKFYLKTKEWSEALQIWEEILKQNPSQEEILLLMSYAYSKLKKYDYACTSAERLYLRNPRHFRNFMNLIALAKKTNQSQKVKQLLRTGVKLFPENPELQALL
ncbi:stage II sporulation protein E [Leptospira ryugenii]|uniref:Stage II sporulation protein E n=1 Tax=Leptospira ryugenii TaxID=1917863 RepID=A0A2P2DX41_9LEPT|nr:SpoIIE family protein phosphatase [Leptospira ryugenii]GBF49208.1 stage II sporulation protein E [Leptospira ryugenii]